MRLRKRMPMLAAALVAAALIGIPVDDAAAAAPVTHSPTYTNPVTAGTVDTFPDPTMIRAKDGDWYAYGTTNPIFNSQGEIGEHILPMLRSADMVHWTYAGEIFTQATKPAWWPAGTRPWAPDIRYVDGSYHLMYALSTGGVALLTSPKPTGPWTDRGLLIRGSGSGCPSGTIDPAMFTDTDGTNYVYWGSYDYLCVSKMNADATALVGDVTQVGRSRRMEGAFVVHRDAYYYLFFSDGGCCDGAFSGYTVKVGRSTSPLGPFTTPSGTSLMDLTSKDGIVLAANGNGWDGPGHNAIQTDVSGQDWLVYHAIPQADPDFPPVVGAGGTGGTLNLSRRPMLIDRLDWINGWPVVNAGTGPSTKPQRAPVTTWTVGSTFNTGSLSGWDGDWSLANDPDSLGYLSSHRSSLELSEKTVRGDVRVEGDLRLGAGSDAAGLMVDYAGKKGHIEASLNRVTGTLTVDVTAKGKTTRKSSALPAGFDYDAWNTLVVDRRGSTLTAQVSADQLLDPQATLTMTLPAHTPASGRIGVTSIGGGAGADNVGAAPLYRPVTAKTPDPVLGKLLPAYSDDFQGTGTPQTVDPAWMWVRPGTANATEAGGSLVWPTQQAELNNGNNTASVLTRDAPSTDFIVETKLGFDGTVGNQQAGMVLYENDDRFVKLVHSVLPLNGGNGAMLQQTEFDKEAERPTATPPAAVFAGPMFGGPASPTEWLRMYYHYDAARDENVVRMASSTDGTAWTWGGSWSMQHRGPIKIGLISMNTKGATADFDYVHTYGVHSQR